jgi:hypothetical protein
MSDESMARVRESRGTEPYHSFSTMELDHLRCPACDGTVRVVVRTVVRRGVRVPVEPFLSCALGHRIAMEQPGAFGARGEAGEKGLTD